MAVLINFFTCNGNLRDFKNIRCTVQEEHRQTKELKESRLGDLASLVFPLQRRRPVVTMANFPNYCYSSNKIRMTQNEHLKIVCQNLRRGSFNNYVDMIWLFFDHLPTSMWTFFTLNMDQNWHFLTTQSPHFVLVDL